MRLNPIAIAVTGQYGRIQLRPQFSIEFYLRAGGQMQSIRMGKPN